MIIPAGSTFQLLHCFNSGTTWKRIIISLAVEGVVCLVTIILACIDTSSYGGVFFGITMFSVVLMSSKCSEIVVV